MSHYNEPESGEWIRPVETGYKLMCCDCGLVHELDFKVDEEGRVWFRAFRNNRATGQARRYKRKTTEKTEGAELAWSDHRDHRLTTGGSDDHCNHYQMQVR